MPYIGTKTSAAVSRQQADSIKARFGKAIEIFPGKSEQWLMVGIEEKCKMYIAGDGSEDTAFVEVKLLGKADKASYSKMTAEICNIISDELSISPERIYVQYEECEHWGWNGGNF